LIVAGAVLAFATAAYGFSYAFFGDSSVCTNGDVNRLVSPRQVPLFTSAAAIESRIKNVDVELWVGVYEGSTLIDTKLARRFSP
jgi:hypothetical protein